MSTRNPSFHQSMIRSPASSHHGGFRSADRFQGRSVPSTHPLDLPPMDSQARYSISYVPGMSEHVVNTGKTLQEAQLKVVLLACEVERLNTLNYNLVKENEILKAQGLKNDREKDLEIKLAIVLAENEKLIQVIEELHEVYQRQRGSQPAILKGDQYNEDYERRIEELIDSLEEWKQRYGDLERSQNIPGSSNGLQKTVRDLEQEKNILTDRLVRQESDLEALRARLNSIEIGGPVEGKDMQQRISSLMIENERFRKELDMMKLKHGDANVLQLKMREHDDKVRTLIQENEKLNRILNEKMRELQSLKNIVPESPKSNYHEVSMDMRGRSGYKDRGEKDKSTLGRTGESDLRLQDLVKENVNLAGENDRLNQVILRQVRGGNEPGNVDQLRGRLDLVLKENERLNHLLGEKVKEIEELKSEPGVGRTESVDEQIRRLLKENSRLNEVLSEKIRDNEELRRRLGEGGPNTATLDHFQEKVILVSGENERLIREVEQLRREAEQLRRQLDDARRGVSTGPGITFNTVGPSNAGEVEGLRREVDHLRRQLEDARRGAGVGTTGTVIGGIGSPSENERLAREVDHLRRQLDDARRGVSTGPGITVTGPSNTAEIEGLRREVDHLRRQLDDSRRALSTSTIGTTGQMYGGSPVNTAEVDGLRREVDHLRKQLDEARRGTGPTSTYIGGIGSPSENERLNREVDHLRGQLENAKKSSPSAHLGAGPTTTQVSDFTRPQDPHQVGNLIEENRRLNDAVNNKNRENEGLKRRNQELELTAGTPNHLRDQINNLLTENRRLNDVLNDRLKEIDSLRARLNEPVHNVGVGVGLTSTVPSTGGNATVGQLREQIVLITGERDRLSRMLDERVREVEALRETRDTRDSRDIGRVEQLNIQITGLLNENRQLSRELDEVKRKLQETTHSSPDRQVRLLSGENERLNNELDAAKKASTARADQLSIQITGLLNENQRLNGLIHGREEEIERLRRRVTELEGHNAGLGQQQEKLILVSGENERLNGLLVERSREIENLRRQIEDLRRGATREQQLSAQVNGLLDENRRLNDVINERGRENEQLKKRVAELDVHSSTIAHLREQMDLLVRERDGVNRLLAERANEIEGLKRQVEELRAGKARIDQLSVQINGLLDENRRLNDALGDKTRESESNRRRIPEIEAELNRVASERDGANRALTERLAENDTLKRQVGELRANGARLEQLTGQINSLLSENERLNGLTSERAREADQLRKKVVELEAALNATNALKDQINFLAGERDRLSKLLSDRVAEIEALKRQVDELRGSTVRIDQLTGQLNGLLAENERLNGIIVERSKDNDGLRRRLAEVETGFGQTREQLNRAVAEKEDLNRAFTARLSEIDALRRQIEELKGSSARIEQLSIQVNNVLAENKRLNDLLFERTRENEGLRHKAAEAENATATINQLRDQVNALAADRDGLGRTLSERMLEIDNLKRNNARTDQLAVQVTALSDENRRLNDQMVARMNESDGLRRRVNELEATNLTATEDLRKKVNLLSAESENLKHVLNDRVRECESLRQQNAELRAASGEVDRLRHQVSSLSDENLKMSTVVTHVTREAEQLKDIRATVVLLNAEVERLSQLLVEKTREVDNLRIQVDDSRLGHGHRPDLRVQVPSGVTGQGFDQYRGQATGQGYQSPELRVQVNTLVEENRRKDEKNEALQKRIAELETVNRPVGGEEHVRKSYNIGAPTGGERHIVHRGGDTEESKRRPGGASGYEQGGSREGYEGSTHLSMVIEDNRSLNKDLEAKSREADDWRTKFFDLQRDSYQTAELRTRLQNLQAENERLNGLLGDKQRDLDELRRKYMDLQANAGQVDEFRTKFVLKCQENDRLNSIIQDKIREMETLRMGLGGLDASPTKTPHAVELQERVRTLAAENSRLNQELIQRSYEIEELQHRLHHTSEGDYHGDDELREQLAYMTAENERLNLILQAKTTETEYARVSPLKSDAARRSGVHDGGHIRIGDTEGSRSPYRGTEDVRRAGSTSVSPARDLGSDYRPGGTSERKMKSGQGMSPSPYKSYQHGDIEGLNAEIDRLTRLLIEKENEVDRLRRTGGREGSTTQGGSDYRARELETRLEMAQNEIERLHHELEESRHHGDFGGRYSGSPTKGANVEGLLRDIEGYKRRINELEGQQAKGTAGGAPLSAGFGGDERLRQEVDRLNRLLADKQREIEDLAGRPRRVEERSRLSDDYEPTGDLTRRFASERQALEGEILGLRQKVLDLEEKVRILGDDNHQLSIINEERLIDVDAWKQRYEQFERQKINEIEALRREYDDKLREEVERSARNVREGPEMTITELRREKLVLEERVNGVNREMERLREYLDSAVAENEDLRERYVELENLRSQELGELKKQFENFRKTNVEIKEMQVKFAAERTAYETQILQLQQKVLDLENQVEMLLSENDRITTLSLERLREIELWKKKYSQVDENYTLEVGELKSQLEMFKSSNYDVKQLAIKYSAEKAADHSQIKQLKQMNENYKSELEKLYDLMNQRKVDFESLTRQNDELRKLYEKMSTTAQDQNSENTVMYERFDMLQREINELEKSREEYKKQAERNSIELTRKNKELVDKIQELDILRMKYEEALANYQSLNSKLFDRLMTES